MDDFFKIILILCLVASGLFVIEHEFYSQMESAYAEGQMDAKKGDYKIEYDSIHKTWYWKGSPWDDGTSPIFNINNIKK